MNRSVSSTLLAKNVKELLRDKDGVVRN